MKPNETKRLGEILVENGIITQDQLFAALKELEGSSKRLGEVLVEHGLVDERQISVNLEIQLGYKYLELEELNIDPELPRLIPEKLARRHLLIPVHLKNNILTVAMANPSNIYAIDDVKIATDLEVEPAIATRQDILTAIGLYYEKEGAERALQEFDQTYIADQTDDNDDEIVINVEKAPVVKLLNSVIRQAIKMRASDIHIEPMEKYLRIRVRVDGELQEIMRPPQNSHSALITRIKIMGRMNIAEKRVPQDGRLEMEIDEKVYDMRLAVIPTVYGEKVMIRLLDRSSVMMSKHELGFTDDNLLVFSRIIQHPHGIILVTGPTGSGKTTTLYAVLHEINSINRNIITVEDPVEYRIDGINQTQINQKAGLTFASGLRSILRHDPDVIMIGEIRDTETAQIAIRAAITGHLVLATLHTNSTVSTINRLIDMGVEPYLISSATVGIMAQRLVKKICYNCKEPYQPDELKKDMLGLENGDILYHGTGCNVCNQTGYKGRTGIHEIMPVTDSIRSMIDKQDHSERILNKSIEYGMTTLRDNCIGLVRNGTISFEEFMRVTYSLE
ncbi:MAG: type II/IV secretion system protein [Tindallia sp. MSAO_Bac2]|nr:MAG: type II/IV secretion system protein [Tindallia sp. MSAO_Bac2]